MSSKYFKQFALPLLLIVIAAGLVALYWGTLSGDSSVESASTTATATSPPLTPASETASTPTATLSPATATATTVPLPQPTSTPTPLTPVPPAPSPTPDEISRIKAANANQPEIVAPLLTPDGDWEAKTVVYGCIDIGDNQVMAYELLILTELASGEEVVVAEQQLNCGGLGASGLAALFWSPSSRYLYYTDARDGVPDGCGFWQPTILRWDRTTGQTERLGGGVSSPDGTMVAVWLPQERAIAVWDADGDELGRVPAAAEAFPGQMAWSPDSQALVYLQVSSYCPPAGPSYIVRLDVATLEQTILLEAEQQAFRHVTWDAPPHLTLTDENEQRWTFDVDSQTLEVAMNQPAPPPDDLTFAAMETVVAFNQTGGMSGPGPFLEISADLWHPAIADLQPLRVYWHQNNLAVVLEETDATESGLYIGVPISSYMPQSDETIQLTHEADGLLRFSKKRSD